MATGGRVVDADGGDGGVVTASVWLGYILCIFGIRDIFNTFGILKPNRTLEGSIKGINGSTLCMLIVCSRQEGFLGEACWWIPNSLRPRLPSLLCSAAESSTNLVLRNRLVIGTVGDGPSHCDVERLRCVVRDKMNKMKVVQLTE